MKRSPIKRRTPLRSKPKAAVKHTAAFFERKKKNNAKEYQRRKLKAELLAECPRDGDIILCPLCGKRPDFRGLQLVHKRPGRRMVREDCVIRCGPCHFGHAEPWSHRTEGKPGKGDPSEKGPSQISAQDQIQGDASGLT